MYLEPRSTGFPFRLGNISLAIDVSSMAQSTVPKGPGSSCSLGSFDCGLPVLLHAQDSAPYIRAFAILEHCMWFSLRERTLTGKTLFAPSVCIQHIRFSTSCTTKDITSCQLLLLCKYPCLVQVSAVTRHPTQNSLLQSSIGSSRTFERLVLLHAA